MEPTTFTRASRAGSVIARRTLDCPARCMTTSGRVRSIKVTTCSASSATSSRWNSNPACSRADARLSSIPVRRASSAGLAGLSNGRTRSCYSVSSGPLLKNLTSKRPPPPIRARLATTVQGPSQTKSDAGQARAQSRGRPLDTGVHKSRPGACGHRRGKCPVPSKLTRYVRTRDQ
jgi:hypothetical protein